VDFEKNHNFWPISSYSLEMLQNRVEVTMEH